LMSSKSFSRKAKTQRGKRSLESRAPKLVENVKKSIIVKGPKTSAVIVSALSDMHKLKAPDSKLLTRKNVTRPFEDQSSIEFLGSTNDCSLFSYGSHSKKRPHNLVMGRLFDGQVLDMFEFTIDADSFKSLKDFEGKRSVAVKYGGKPMFVFAGEEFETREDFALLKSFLLDYFRGEVLEKINLAGLDRLISVSAINGKIYFRHYGIALKQSGSKLPRVELEEVGPSMDLVFRRHHSAAEDVRKQAMRVPKAATLKLDKNRERNALGEAVGRVHMKRQDLSQLPLAKMKGLKGKRKRDGEEGGKTSASGYGPSKGPKQSEKGAVKKARSEGGKKKPSGPSIEPAPVEKSPYGVPFISSE